MPSRNPIGAASYRLPRSPDDAHHRHTVNRVRWIVDGMNVIGSRPDGWWRDRHRAMVELVDRLEQWARSEGTDVTVVFERPPAPPIESKLVTVTHAPTAAPNSADDEIVRLVCSDAHPEQIGVATSDRKLAARVRSANATVFPADRLRDLIDPRGSVPPYPAAGLRRPEGRGNGSAFVLKIITAEMESASPGEPRSMSRARSVIQLVRRRPPPGVPHQGALP